MTSLAQISANRANAAKSTGPTTVEGKDASRRNALTHGMAARTLVLPVEEGELIAARIVAWTPVLAPRDKFDAWLVEQVAVSSVRIEHCQAHENSLRTGQATRAALCWDIDRECDAEDLGATLARSPAKVARKLRRTKQGCQWMIARWEGLGRVLEFKGDWDEAQRRLALDLLGLSIELRDGPTPLDGDRPALIRDQLSRLRSLVAQALEELDEQERAAAEVGLGPDYDKSVSLCRRYEAACVRRMDQAHAQLRKNRKAEPAEDRRPEPSPEARALARESADLARRERMLSEHPVRPQPAPASAPAPSPIRPMEPAPTLAPAGGNRKNRRARRALARRG